MPNVETKEREHALLSASAAHRWLTCTPSVLLELGEGAEECSVYAEEGTAAHKLAELKLERLYGKITDEIYLKEFEDFCKTYGQYYNAEFEEYVDSHVAFVKSVTDDLKVPYHIYFEVTVNFSNIVPQGFGTADVLIVTDTMIHVIDLKFGVGVPVSAIGNPQLRLYGFGALNMFPNTKDIFMTINQPRLPSRDTDTLCKEELLKWGFEEVAPKAELAIKGEGPLVSTEEACRFCKLRQKCKARADKQFDSAKEEFLMAQDKTTKLPIAPKYMSKEQLSRILDIAPLFIDWFKDVKAFAVDQLRAGEKIPGYKLVEGKSNRVITDPDKVKEILMGVGVDEKLLMEPPKMKGISKLEALVGKSLFASLCADYLIKPPGTLTLAPVDDSRLEANTLTLAKEDFSTSID